VFFQKSNQKFWNVPGRSRATGRNATAVVAAIESGLQPLFRDALVDEVLSEFGDRVGLLDVVQGAISWRSLVLFQEMKEPTIGSPWVQVLIDSDSGSLAEPEFGVHGQDEGHQSQRHNRVREFFQAIRRADQLCRVFGSPRANCKLGTRRANRPASRMGHCSTAFWRPNVVPTTFFSPPTE
jgi:hypothetical protein